VDIVQVLFGDLRQLMPRPYSEIVLVATAFLCGALVGFERERGHKPAGLRTLILICVGSAIFTVVSASPSLGGHEPARIAAQIVTGIGFLGAGSILRDRHHISGLTTAATIWACSGIGIVVGAGYAAAGVVLSAAVLITLGWVRRLEVVLNGACQVRRVLVVYQPSQGKTRPRITALLRADGLPHATVNRYARETSAARCAFSFARRSASPALYLVTPVRRLFAMIEESIAKSMRWVVFEPNDLTLWK